MHEFPVNLALLAFTLGESNYKRHPINSASKLTQEGSNKHSDYAKKVRTRNTYN